MDWVTVKNCDKYPGLEKNAYVHGIEFTKGAPVSGESQWFYTFLEVTRSFHTEEGVINAKYGFLPFYSFTEPFVMDFEQGQCYTIKSHADYSIAPAGNYFVTVLLVNEMGEPVWCQEVYTYVRPAHK